MEIDRIYCGDSLELIRGLPDKSIDLVLTDPPYGHNNNNGDLISRWEAALGRGDYLPERDDRPIANDGIEANEIFKLFLVEANRVLKPGCCCCGGGPDPQFARWSLWLDAIIGFKMMVVWDKGPMGMGWHYRRSYETILVGQKKGRKCKWYDTTSKVENVIRNIGKIIPTSEQHPTEKPVKLMEHFINLHTEEGDLVLDPFIGSGTTAVACVNANRHFIGMELSSEYCKIAEGRVLQARLDKAERDRQIELFQGGE